MALDMKKLNGVQKNLDEGDGNVLFQNKFGNEADIRLLPPHPELEGVYFSECQVNWVGGKSYLSNATFGEADVVDEEVKAAKKEIERVKASGTNSEKAAIKDLELLVNDEKKLKLGKKEYIMAILHLDLVLEGSEVKSLKIHSDKPKFLSCSSQLLGGINKEVVSRFTQPDITDRVKGFNILLQKKGINLDTEYTARAWPQPYEMPDDKFYKDLLNPMDYIRSRKKSDAFLRSVIRNYLYGEPLLKDEKASSETASYPEARESKQEPAKEVDNRAPMAREGAKQESKPTEEVRGASSGRVSSGTSLLADLDND